MAARAPATGVDVLIVSLGSTAGLRAADEELAQGLRRAGASAALASAVPPRPVRTFVLTDLVWARAARGAAVRALAGPAQPRAILYSTTTAALLWPRPGAIRFDAPAAANRPGRHGLWQRPLERRRLMQTPLLLPSSEGALAELPEGVGDAQARALVVPVPVEPSGPPAPARDIAAITYGANPAKKGLDRVLAAWRAARARRPPGEELVIAGVSAAELQGAGLLSAGEPGVRVTGLLDAERYRALLRRARVFVCAPRREDYGVAQLEALADGCQLVTTAAPGPYVALPLARGLDARLVGEDLAGALTTALERPAGDYAARARAALAPYSRGAVDALIAAQLVARLLA
jgi:glycosyltransferase involved in cell wall biosynthesis